ncbi:hypothetical protein V5O48_017068, partial [Marasmius crinis-equi]
MSHRKKRTKISEFVDVEAASSADEGEDEVEGFFEEETENQELEEASRNALGLKKWDQEDEWDGFINHLSEKYGPNRRIAPEASNTSALSIPSFQPPPPESTSYTAYPRSQLRYGTRTFASSQHDHVQTAQLSAPETNSHNRAKALMCGTKSVGDVDGRQWMKEDETQWKERQRHGVASGEWVTVRCGTYKGDVGLAVQPDLVGHTTSTMEGATDLQKTIMSSYTTETSDEIMVLLIPRLDTNPSSLYTSPSAGKRKRTANNTRPSPVLFDPECHNTAEKVKDGYPYEKGRYHYKEPMFSIPEGNWLKQPKLFYFDSYRYNNQIFVGGLLLKSYKKRSLAPAVSIPAHLELLFSRSSNPDVSQFPMPHPQHWVFEEGEEILYEPKVTPEHEDPIKWDTPLRFKCLNISKRGRNPQTVSLHTTLSSKYIEYSAPVRAITKRVRLRDHVLILAGAHRGMSGMVTAIRSQHVQILAMSVGETPSTIATHVNATRVISPGGHVGEVKIPWLNALVKVTRGEFADC